MPALTYNVTPPAVAHLLDNAAEALDDWLLDDGAMVGTSQLGHVATAVHAAADTIAGHARLAVGLHAIAATLHELAEEAVDLPEHDLRAAAANLTAIAEALAS